MIDHNRDMKSSYCKLFAMGMQKIHESWDKIRMGIIGSYIVQ